ncbi:MAG: hypothetical protein K0Q73_5497 [Paenibacillus sp.]|jgi:iron complex transport system substrate-binding protein|nr:hypothetical protein [Paenibacillus sp.]
MLTFLRFKRNSLLLCLIATVMVITAVGCSSTTPKETAPAAKVSAPAQNDAPRTVKHAMGEETLTGTPQRVIILTNEGTEALLTVGIKPVGAVKSWVGDPWYDHIKADMQGVTVLGEETQPNIELIAGLKPDLIIGNKVRHEKIYEQLKKIAPTVFAEKLSGDWKSNFKLYALAVNKKDEGDKKLAEFDKRVADVKAKLGTKAATKVSIVRFTAGDTRIYQKQTFGGVLLNQLGIARPAAQDKDQFVETITKERTADMDGDVMFYFLNEVPGKTDASKAAEEWIKNPLFQNLNVAKTNKVFKVNEVVWNLAGGYKAANLLLDEISKYFEIK